MKKSKKYLLGLLSAVIVFSNILTVNAAPVSTDAAEMARANGAVSIESYWTTNPFDEQTYVMFTYRYVDGNSVNRTGFSYTNNGRTWSENISDSFGGDRLTTTAILTSMYSFTCKAWCDIYGDTGH